MTTVFANVVGSMVTALSAGTPVSPHISRARIKPLAAEWATAVVVRLQESQFERLAIFGAPINTDTLVVVECYARSTSLSPDLAVDALMQDAYARLAADPTLGGTVADCQLQAINFDFDHEQDRMGCALMTYLIRHRTQSLNLE
jgi:hypothetical protein